MRIKRFTAPDMRTALRMVREEQGPDAVILSNRPYQDGVEVVAATDYDEALVHQALRAAAPKVAPAHAAPAPGLLSVPASAPAAAPVAARMPAAVPAPPPAPEPMPTHTTTTSVAASTAAPTSKRGSLASRARAVFGIGDSGAPASRSVATDPPAEPTLAELTASVQAASTDTPSTDAAEPAVTAQMDSATPTRFEAMMAALNAAPPISAGNNGADQGAVDPGAAVAAEQAGEIRATEPDRAPLELSLEPMAAPAPALIDRSIAHSIAPTESATAESRRDTVAAPTLHSVPRWDADPGVAAMREELASMRQLIEREMGQFTLERLRGSPARAAGFDLLLGYGCNEQLAQSLAARLDPTLAPDKVRAPLLAELARMLTITRHEPLEDGGVIALIGPTGAGKTTTAAKLAARYAARHRARDVALVTTDAERVGAREQLHAHGRRLSVTVCEAHGPEALAQTLEQLQDYPLVVVDTAGFGARDRALLGQITWLRATRNVRSLLVLPANAHPHDMNEVVRRYRMAAPEGVVLTKLDETGRLGAALSVVIDNDLSLAYTADGQHVTTDLAHADASHLVLQLEKLRRAADNPLVIEDRHAVVA